MTKLFDKSGQSFQKVKTQLIAYKKQLNETNKIDLDSLNSKT